jgi:F-type H+-transporting ATPase subunit epsilon
MAEHPNTFHLVIASVGETRFDGAAASATFPGSAGEFTVMPRHEALVTTLRPGKITVREAAGDAKEFDIESGVLECAGGKVVVLL